MSKALYRRYRPDSFAEVIGQEHVTTPLMQALRSNRVNHAYLFSGPRGCGKTTSARILARILNCAQNTPENPRDTPCNECDSCSDLARGGPGSLDVVEIDAASHGGVDDARELRERATFSPSRDRFKIFILDEAHMVTPQGFNALLKIVEEPPEYLKFIFATTEPDKVIGTIRSRTHHYPFRLVPPEVLTPYLEQLCASEGVQVGAGVLPLVVRAGGGSVRDSLSVMDQLIAGSSDSTVDYELAVALLGYTHVTLLDDVVEALAAGDGASVFRVVEKVITTGHEPRRFVEDLLERLRDLILIAVSGESADAVLRDLPADQLARMHTQAGNLGAGELSRAADLVNAALSEMSGATSPRLHLELLCARLLIPTADDGAQGHAARLDRLERGLGSVPAAGIGGSTVSGGDAGVVAAGFSHAGAGRGAAGVRDALSQSGGSAPAPRPDSTRPDSTRPDSTPTAPRPDSTPRPVASDPATSGTGSPTAPPAHPATPPDASAPTHGAAPTHDPVPAVATAGEPVANAASPGTGDSSAEATPKVADSTPSSASPTPISTEPAPSEPEPTTAPAGGSSSPDTEVLRRRWPEVLDTLSRLRKTSWALVSQNAQVVELSDTTLQLSFASPGLANAFRNGPHPDLVQQAVSETLGFSVRVEGSVAEAGGSGGSGAASPAPAPTPAPQPSQAEARPEQPSPVGDVAPPGDVAPNRDNAPAHDPSPAHGSAPAPETAPPVEAASPESAGDPALTEETTRSQSAPEPPAQNPADVTWDVVPVGGSGGGTTPQGAQPTTPPARTPEAREASAQNSSSKASAPSAVTPASPVAQASTTMTSSAGASESTTVEGAAPATDPLGTPETPGQQAPRATRREMFERQAAEDRAARETQPPPEEDIPPFDEEPPFDDRDSVPFTESTLTGPPLVAKLLGGQVIEEIIDQVD